MSEERELRPHATVRTVSEFGKTRSLIECPFCGEPVWAYHWSLAGGGKKCPNCGAKHTWWGTLSRKEEKK